MDTPNGILPLSRPVPEDRLTIARLHAAEDKHRPDRNLPDMTAAERIVARYWEPFQHSGLPKGLSENHPAYVFVNHGNWLIQCQWCGSAQHASRQDHRFFCVECGNRAAGGKWVPTVWPDQHPEIETILSARADKRTRNWTPGETLGGLLAENLAHNV